MASSIAVNTEKEGRVANEIIGMYRPKKWSVESEG